MLSRPLRTLQAAWLPQRAVCSPAPHRLSRAALWSAPRRLACSPSSAAGSGGGGGATSTRPSPAPSAYALVIDERQPGVDESTGTKSVAARDVRAGEVLFREGGA
eukprot:366795-Prymnesium_polylepis.1